MTCLHKKPKRKLNFTVDLKEINKSSSNSSSKYDNFIFLDDLNIEPEKLAIKDFLNLIAEA